MLWVFLKKKTTKISLYKYKEDMSTVDRQFVPKIYTMFDLKNWSKKRKSFNIFKKLKKKSFRNFKYDFLKKTFMWKSARRRKVRKFFNKYIKKQKRAIKYEKDYYTKFKVRMEKCFKEKSWTTKKTANNLSIGFYDKMFLVKNNRLYSPIKKKVIFIKPVKPMNLKGMVEYGKILPIQPVMIGKMLPKPKPKRKTVKIKVNKYFKKCIRKGSLFANRVYAPKRADYLFFFKKKKAGKLRFRSKKNQVYFSKNIQFFSKKKSPNRAALFGHIFFKKKLLKLSRLEWDVYDAEAEETFFAKSDYPGKSKVFLRNLKKILKKNKYYQKKDYRTWLYNYNFYFLKRRKKLFLWKRYLNDRVYFKIRRLQNKIARCGEFGWELFIQFYKYKFIINKYNGLKNWPADIIINHKVLKFLLEMTQYDRYEHIATEINWSLKRMLSKWHNGTFIYSKYDFFFQKNKSGFIIKKNKKYRNRLKYLGLKGPNNTCLYGKSVINTEKNNVFYLKPNSGQHWVTTYLRRSYGNNILPRTFSYRNKNVLYRNKRILHKRYRTIIRHGRFAHFARRLSLSLFKHAALRIPSDEKIRYFIKRVVKLNRTTFNRYNRFITKKYGFFYKNKIKNVFNKNNFTNKMISHFVYGYKIKNHKVNYKLRAFYFLNKRTLNKFMGLFFIWKKKRNILDRVFISRKKKVFTFRVKKKLKNVYYKNLIKLSKPVLIKKELFTKYNKKVSLYKYRYQSIKGGFIKKFRKKLAKNLPFTLTPRYNRRKVPRYIKTPFSLHNNNSFVKKKLKVLVNRKGLIKSNSNLMLGLKKKNLLRRDKPSSLLEVLFSKKKIKFFYTSLQTLTSRGKVSAHFCAKNLYGGRKYNPSPFKNKKVLEFKKKVLQDKHILTVCNSRLGFIKESSSKISKSLFNLDKILNSKIFFKKSKIHKFMHKFMKLLNILYLNKFIFGKSLLKLDNICAQKHTYFFLKNPKLVLIILIKAKRTLRFSIRNRRLPGISISKVYGKKNTTYIRYLRGLIDGYYT